MDKFHKFSFDSAQLSYQGIYSKVIFEDLKKEKSKVEDTNIHLTKSNKQPINPKISSKSMDQSSDIYELNKIIKLKNQIKEELNSKPLSLTDLNQPQIKNLLFYNSQSKNLKANKGSN